MAVLGHPLKGSSDPNLQAFRIDDLSWKAHEMTGRLWGLSMQLPGPTILFGKNISQSQDMCLKQYSTPHWFHVFLPRQAFFWVQVTGSKEPRRSHRVLRGGTTTSARAFDGRVASCRVVALGAVSGCVKSSDPIWTANIQKGTLW